MEYLLAIDQGTTSTTALIMNHRGQVLSSATEELAQHYPDQGMVEHLPGDIKSGVETAVVSAIAKASISAADIAGIGIANQRETFSFFDIKDGWSKAFIVWQCRRSLSICQELVQRNLEDPIKKTTGLRLDPYFSASKALWLFRKNPELLRGCRSGRLGFGTVDTFLCHWLSGGALHITDVTNASRTMLMDIASLTYSDLCLDVFGVPKACLPTIENNLGPYGKTSGLGFLPDGIPIAAIAGDQQAALFGQRCFNQGMTKLTLGTGSFILINTKENIITSEQGLLTTVGYRLKNTTNYCLEGSAFIAGAAVQFLRDSLGTIASADEIEGLANTVNDSGGVVFAPALCGLGAPHWLPHARGVISGLERGTKKGHIARATLEAIALQNTDILTAMAKDNISPTVIKVDGGAVKNDLLMQMHADLSGVPLHRTVQEQKTAQGAAYLAGLALGIFSSVEEIESLAEEEEIFTRQKSESWASSLINDYHRALAKL